MKTLRAFATRHSLLATLCCAAFATPFFIGRAEAQRAPAQATATVTGRVSNVVTGNYLKNAEVRLTTTGADVYVYTEEDGSYSITVPAGTVELTASYTGVRPSATSITAAPDSSNVINFDLQPLVIDPAAANAATGDVYLMDRFVVTTDRTGQAKAIMDQRAAINAISIIAADNFGDITMDSVGEVLKYMPGISIEYDDTDATGARIGGLPTKYTTAAIDGVAISTSDRAVNLTDLTITGVEFIEFIQTLTADMDAGSAAGRLNFRTKDPFSRKKSQLQYQFGMNGHQSAFNFGGAYMPDDRKHNLVFPSAQINYGDYFLNRRVAIEFNISYNGAYNFSQRQITTYAYRNRDPKVNPDINFLSDDPVITQLSWASLPSITHKYGSNLNLGFKISPRLTLSLRNSYKHDELEYFTLNSILRAYHASGGAIINSPNNTIDPIASTLTHWVVNGIGDNKSRLFNDYSHRFRTIDTLASTQQLVYKGGNFTIEAYTGYTGTVRRYHDTDKGFFSSSDSYLANISWVADRPSTSSPAWTLTQTGGDPWSAPENWSKRNRRNLGVRSYGLRTETKQYVGGLDFSKSLRIFGMPVTLKAGGLFRRNDYSYRERDDRYNYLGPTGNPLEAVIPYSQNYVYSFPLGGKGGNISEQGWRVDDTYALYKIYQEHPEWFSPSKAANLRRSLINRRDLAEDITSAYIMMTGRLDRLRYNIGLRFEDTSIETLQLLRRSGAEVVAAGHPVSSSDAATTEAGVLYQYHNGERLTRRHGYNNMFGSGGLKYDITSNLQAQFSFSQSILRPDYANLSGTVNYDSVREVLYIPNSLLKPEFMTKYHASISYTAKEAGSIVLSIYRMDIRDKQIRDWEITLDEAERIVGYPLTELNEDDDDDTPSAPVDPDDPDASLAREPDNIYRTTINSPSKFSVYGITLAYDRQLTFLPGMLKGISLFGSYTISSIHASQIAEDRIGQVKRSANGGIRYRYARFHVQFRGTWNDSTLVSVTRPISGRYYFNNDYQYLKARCIFDLSGGFKLSNRCELSFSVRNLFNSPIIWYSDLPDRVSRYNHGGGCYWNISIKGSF